MPRKTIPCLATRVKGDSFNEAAARCHGKQPAAPPAEGERQASMRPRPDATENFRAGTSLYRRLTASMRPRPDATENGGAPAPQRPDPVASMRPRPDATENDGSLRQRGRGAVGASMRPRPDATENTDDPDDSGPRRHRFNEAAARCHGKHSHYCAGGHTASRFNEAAARCHGKPRRPPAGGRRGPCFNEAAARCHGKCQHGTGDRCGAVRASMRPRPDATENEKCARRRQSSASGFNEAAARCHGKPRRT